jgi:hypothetical protein
LEILGSNRPLSKCADVLGERSRMCKPHEWTVKDRSGYGKTIEIKSQLRLRMDCVFWDKLCFENVMAKLELE